MECTTMYCKSLSWCADTSRWMLDIWIEESICKTFYLDIRWKFKLEKTHSFAEILLSKLASMNIEHLSISYSCEYLIFSVKTSMMPQSEPEGQQNKIYVFYLHHLTLLPVHCTHFILFEWIEPSDNRIHAYTFSLELIECRHNIIIHSKRTQ